MSDQPKPYRLTRTERLARRRVLWNLWCAQEDHPPMQDIRDEVPDAWHIIVEDLDCFEAKEKVTLYLDRSVAKAFKAMGKGYQARINRILLTWLQLKAGRMLEVEEMMARREQEVLARDRAAQDQHRPGWAEMVDTWPQEEPPEG